jgi:hypothetical protein
MNETIQEPTFWAAPDLAKAGYMVFPLAGKAPAVAGGFYAATRDLSEIARWIEDGYGDHDIGIATGLPSGIVVIEADKPHRRAQLEERFGPPTVTTKKGGHWYFKHPRDGKVVSRNIVSDIDCKADGGYVAAPPSTGKAWTNGIPKKEDLPDLPKGLREDLRTGSGTTSPNGQMDSYKLGEFECLQGAAIIARRIKGLAHGERHEHLKHLCGALLARGLSPESAEAMIAHAWRFAGGELAERAPKEVPNTIRTTVAAMANGGATGVPSMEKLTPGLYAELEDIFSKEDPILVDNDVSSLHSPIYGGSDDETSEDEAEPKIVWFHELGEPKEREYLIEHIGVKGYPVVVYGAGGVAKSFAVLAAGIAIASDRTDRWLGLKVLEHGHCLYLDFELDQDEQHRRVRDLCAGLEIPPPKRLAYLSGVGLSTEKVFQKAVAFAKKYKAKAVVVDSMGLAMAGSDMDRHKEVITFHTRFMNPLRRVGATPYIVDHESKMQAGENRRDKSPIGSVFKSNLSRNVLQFSLEEYDKENSVANIRVRQHKTNFEPMEPWGVRFSFGDKIVKIETYDLPEEELAGEKTKLVIDRIRIALAREDMSIVELEAATGASRGTLYNKLVELMDAGEVVKRQEGRSSIYSSNV